jgi:hypothetical protein
MALLEYCQSSAAGFLLLIRCSHLSVEEEFVNTAIKTLNVGDEKGESGGGRMVNTMMTTTEGRRREAIATTHANR